MLSVSVSDVAPDGTVTRLTGGWQVISHRALDKSRTRYLDGKIIQPFHPFTRAAKRPLATGEIAPVDVEVFPTAAQILPGHRLRIAIQAFDVPHLLPTVTDLPGSADRAEDLRGRQVPVRAHDPGARADRSGPPMSSGGAQPVVRTWRPSTSDRPPASVARLVRGVRDDQLSGPTPCPAYTVADLLDHVGGLALAFRCSADRGSRCRGTATPRATGPGWRTAGGTGSPATSTRWRPRGATPRRTTGMTMAGPIEMPADIAALVAIDEVVVHGWDLARATGQDYAPDEAAVLAAHGFASSFEPPDGRRRRRALRTSGRRSRRTLRRWTGWPVPPDATRTGSPDRFLGHEAPPVISPAVACPSGRRCNTRNVVWGQTHRGFKSHRHRRVRTPGERELAGGSFVSAQGCPDLQLKRRVLVVSGVLEASAHRSCLILGLVGCVVGLKLAHWV